MNAEPLCDILRPDEVRLWYRLVLARDQVDLELEGCNTTMDGEPPDWAWDLELDCIISPEWRPGFDDGGPVTWLTWALENGLCPGQPFLWRCGPPTIHKSYYEQEYEEEWDWDIEARMPRTDKQAGKAWARVLDQIQRNREKAERKRARLSHRHEHTLKAMSIITDVCHRGYAWDPDRVVDQIVRLVSRLPDNYRILAEGRGPTYEEAFENMSRDAIKRLPHLDWPTIHRISKRQHVGGPSVWERIA